MRGSNAWSSLLAVVVIGLACGLPGARTDSPGGEAVNNKAAASPSSAPAKAAPAVMRSEQLARKLAMSITFEFDTGPLKEALEHLSDKYSLPILVDTEAFKADLQMPEVEAQQVKFPKMAGLRLSTVLEKLVGQVGGGFLLQADHIEITTLARISNTVWGTVEPQEDDSGSRRRPRLPLVQEAFEKRPLADALQELADATGISVVVDHRRAGDRVRKPVTAALHNVPLDTAVRLLASQAELQTVLVDNVLYVTTPDHAREIQPAADGTLLSLGRGTSPDAEPSLALHRQLRQPVHLKLEGVSLEAALQQLGREMGLNVVLDRQANKEGQTLITLNLKDVSAETALRILAEMAGLKAVLVANVVLVTTEAKANKLDADFKKGSMGADGSFAGVPAAQIAGGVIGLAGGQGGGQGNLGIWKPGYLRLWGRGRWGAGFQRRCLAQRGDRQGDNGCAARQRRSARGEAGSARR
jgi:hypothetical protein